MNFNNKMLLISQCKDINEDLNISDLLSFYSNKDEIELTSNIIDIITKMIKIDDNCMIILPYDIELYNKENKDYIYTREFLLKTCDVKDIIYLPIGICNINIKLCILNFIKKRDEKFIYNNKKITTVHQTQYINFHEYNSFTNDKHLLIKVPINKIKNNNYSFNYIDYIQDKLISSNNNLIYKTINEIALIEYGNKNNHNNDNNNHNNHNNNHNNNDNHDNDNHYEIYGNKKRNKKSNIYNREGFNIILTKYEVALINEKIFLNNYGISIKPKSDIILHKYLGYYLFYNYKDINLKTIKSFEIEIPSLEIQKEIISYFDNIHNTISLLEKEIIELRKKDLKI